jgi:hypothetical protein
MAKLNLKSVFDGIFLGGKDFFLEGYQWVTDTYDLVELDPKEAENIFNNVKSAFSGKIDKKHLNKINLLWKPKNRKDIFVGLAPVEIFNRVVRSSFRNKVIMIVVEKYENRIDIEKYGNRINLIDPSSGEIRQAILDI